MLNDSEKNARRKVKIRIVSLAGVFIASIVIIMAGLLSNSLIPVQFVLDVLFNLSSTFSSLVLLAMIYFFYRINSTSSNAKEGSLLFLRETAYYKSMELKIVVFQCDLEDISLINSLLSLSDLFPFSAVLSPRENRIFFIFFGTDLQNLRERCYKGLNSLEDVFFKVKRLNREKLELFFTNLGLDGCKAETKCENVTILNPITSKNLNDFLELTNQRNESQPIQDEELLVLSFIPLFKEARYFVFYFNKVPEETTISEEVNTRTLLLSDEKLTFSFFVLTEEDKNQGGDYSKPENRDNSPHESENNQLNCLDLLFCGHNEETISKRIYSSFVTFLSFIATGDLDSLLQSNNVIEGHKDTESEQIQGEFQGHSLNGASDELELCQSENSETHLIPENESTRQREEEFDSERPVEYRFEYISPICLKICNEATRVGEKVERQGICTPNLTYCYNKLFDESYMTRLKEFKQSSIQELVERVISDCNHSSFSQITCLFNLLCYSSSFSGFFGKKEISQIEELLSELSSSKNAKKRLLTAETIAT